MEAAPEPRPTCILRSFSDLPTKTTHIIFFQLSLKACLQYHSAHTIMAKSVSVSFPLFYLTKYIFLSASQRNEHSLRLCQASMSSLNSIYSKWSNWEPPLCQSWCKSTQSLLRIMSGRKPHLTCEVMVPSCLLVFMCVLSALVKSMSVMLGQEPGVSSPACLESARGCGWE